MSTAKITLFEARNENGRSNLAMVLLPIREIFRRELLNLIDIILSLIRMGNSVLLPYSADHHE